VTPPQSEIFKERALRTEQRGILMQYPSSPILLVDNDADTLEMYAAGLACSGYRAILANDVATAARQIQADPPRAVVTDLSLPGGGGWSLIAALKRSSATKEIPVIVLTGWIEPSIPAEARAAGCAAVLTKPCSSDELASLLDEILQVETGTADRT
jgi:two-component system, chemotaxis family, response regulator PixH